MCKQKAKVTRKNVHKRTKLLSWLAFTLSIASTLSLFLSLILDNSFTLIIYILIMIFFVIITCTYYNDKKKNEGEQWVKYKDKYIVGLINLLEFDEFSLYNEPQIDVLITICKDKIEKHPVKRLAIVTPILFGLVFSQFSQFFQDLYTSLRESVPISDVFKYIMSIGFIIVLIYISIETMLMFVDGIVLSFYKRLHDDLLYIRGTLANQLIQRQRNE
jgi:hypothetical protein